MKIMLDTNVLISAIVFGGMPKNLILDLIASNHQLLVSSYIDQEFKEKINEKWQSKSQIIYENYRQMDFIFVESCSKVLADLRDKKDIPVLSDALYYEVDVLLTGDKDFLEANIKKPLIFSPAMMRDFLDSVPLKNLAS